MSRSSKGFMYDDSIFPVRIRFSDDNSEIVVDTSQQLPEGRAFIIIASNVHQAQALAE